MLLGARSGFSIRAKAVQSLAYGVHPRVGQGVMDALADCERLADGGELVAQLVAAAQALAGCVKLLALRVDVMVDLSVVAGNYLRLCFVSRLSVKNWSIQWFITPKMPRRNITITIISVKGANKYSVGNRTMQKKATPKSNQPVT